MRWRVYFRDGEGYRSEYCDWPNVERYLREDDTDQVAYICPMTSWETAEETAEPPMTERVATEMLEAYRHAKETLFEGLALAMHEKKTLSWMSRKTGLSRVTIRRYLRILHLHEIDDERGNVDG